MIDRGEYRERMLKMLVVSRTENEKIIVGNGAIEIVVVEIRGNKVRLGVHAPKDISVHREEVYREIQAAKARVDVSTDIGAK